MTPTKLLAGEGVAQGILADMGCAIPLGRVGAASNVDRNLSPVMQGRVQQENGTVLAPPEHGVQWWLIDHDARNGRFAAGADPRRAAASAVGW